LKDSNQNKNILIIASHSGFGTVHVDKLLPSLVKLNYDITFIGWDRRNEFDREFIRNGIQFNMIFSGWGYANKWLAIALPIWFFKLFIKLIRLNKKQYPVIMAIDFDAAFPQAIAQCFNKVPFIYNIRDNFAMRTTLPKLLRPLIERLDKFNIRKAESIIVPDESRVTAENEVEKKKFNVIYNAAMEVNSPEYLPEDRPLTVYAMGYLIKTRGIELLLDASMKLPDVRFLLAGAVHEDYLMNRIKSKSNVDFRGWLHPEEALKLCFESDVIFTFYDPVSEINRKAASNKWFDAMMAGKPILVNEEVEKSSWVLEHDMGYTCPYGSVNALTDIIEHIRIHPEEASEKGKNGRTLFEQGYSWDNSVKKINNIIQQSLADQFVRD
jgi:glycosyltransferase involved in cell wall biosynthesis